MNTFAIIDGNSLFYRAYYAYPQTLTTSDGKPINAVYGFMTMFFKTLITYQPKYIAIPFDYDRTTFRKAKVISYKANRKDTDQALISQYTTLFEILNAFNIPTIRQKGYEADDFIGTFAKYFKENKFDHKQVDKMILITGDKDIKQALAPDIEMIYITGTFQNQKKITVKTFTEEYGFSPEFFDDYLAICGDSSDNIPGVKGIGQKGAQQLVSTFGSLETMYQNIDKVKEINSRYAKLLTENQQEAFESKFLTTLKTDLDIVEDIESYLIKDLDINKAQQAINQVGFVSLQKQLLQINKIYRFDQLFEQKNYSQEKEISTINSSKSSLKQISPEKFFNENNENVFVWINDFPIRHKTTETQNLFASPQKDYTELWISDQDKNITQIKINDAPRFLKDKEIILFDIRKFLELNINPYSYSDKVLDLKLAVYLNNAGRRDYSLKTITREILLGEYVDNSNLSEEKLALHTLDIIVELYNFIKNNSTSENVTKDVKQNWQQIQTLFEKQKIPFISSESPTLLLCYNMETPLTIILDKMEKRGIRINTNGLKELEQELTKELHDIEQAIFSTIGHEFNVSSPKQVADTIFKELGIGNKKRSTGSDILYELKDHHPSIPLIIKHREISKLLSTYVKGFEKHINTQDGISTIHTTYNQTAVITGRLSSTNPNLQNIPIKSDIGQKFRQLFIPREGFELYSIDYSQFELRLLAHFSEDRQLCNDFIEEKDVHRSTASKVFSKNLEDITPEERRVGKTINFGIMYGLSPYGLARDLNIDPSTASNYIKEYFEHYDGVRIYLDNVIADAKENEFVQTMFGRRRKLPFINSTNKKFLGSAVREAINMPAQGSQADLIKFAMIAVDNLIENKYLGKAFLILQIHDEFVIEIDPKIKDNFIKEVDHLMENIIELKVPLVVNAEKWDNK
ncbi:MAG TPA: DNA polymerase I [Candidatus Dojkabacteria bacterium]|nr:DNA polymerase I [Candidatus Dojkabacteria bacterium]HQF36346.1 DNA polymerase I [Candidatus Dojkabacteria bacterium]